MQLILVFETKNNEGSDYYYWRSVLNRFYDAESKKLYPLFLGGKGNYSKLENKIRNRIKIYKDANRGIQAPSKVVFFIDADADCGTASASLLNNEIEKYCSKNSYELVWFKRDVEDVFLNKAVSNNLKAEEAKRFFVKNKIKDVNEAKLSKNCPLEKLHNGESNILSVMDTLLKRKG